MASETVGVVRSRLRSEAMRHGVNPRDVDLLLSDMLQRPVSYVIAHGDETIDTMRLERMMSRRYKGEPLQYIRGRTEFFSRDFFVDDRVLIPRPETEILVEIAIQRAPQGARVIDIGTGSGCIAISLERERPDLHVFAADLSVGALAVASRNRRTHESRVSLLASDVFHSIRGHFDVVVSNPPYIAGAEVATLATEVRNHEPRLALTPGERGTEIIERLLNSVRAPLVLIEIGYGQARAVREIAESRGFTVEKIVPDLAGIPRVAVITV
jgi:release factor glutamine methyltransferase